MNSAIPLAERLRPKTLADLVGQEHLSSPESVLQKAITKGKVVSQKEYDETVIKKMEEFREMNQGRGGRGGMEIRINH